MNWTALSYEEAVENLRAYYGFDFVSIGLAPRAGAALRWLHTSGATGERYKRIVLSPGHGVGGIVLKAGKPMLFTDIDTQLDPREYSSYPIVFAEDLHSFFALPLLKNDRVVGVLLCAFRVLDAGNEQAMYSCIEEIKGGICDFAVRSEGFLQLEELDTRQTDSETSAQANVSLSLDAAREEERRSISRELHDGLAQELLSVSMLVKQIGILHSDSATTNLVQEAENSIDRILDDTRNLSVQLRPLALDDLGLAPALRAQADVYRKLFGAEITVDDNTDRRRFDTSMETHAFRIAQEALLNACKYSNSDTIDVIVDANETTLSIAVCDQGVGFNVNQPTIKGHGCGLGSMRERAALISATLNIYSTGEGTTIALTVPLA